MKFWNLDFGIKLISKTRSREPVAAGPTIASSVVRELRFAAAWGTSCNGGVSARGVRRGATASQLCVARVACDLNTAASDVRNYLLPHLFQK